MRQKVEKAIVAALVERLHTIGFKPVMVDDGGEEVSINSTATPFQVAIDEVVAAVFAVDEARVYFQQKDEARKTLSTHWVFLVCGNGHGDEIISDHSYTEGDADGFMAALDQFQEDLEDAELKLVWQDKEDDRMATHGCKDCGEPSDSQCRDGFTRCREHTALFLMKEATDGK